MLARRAAPAFKEMVWRQTPILEAVPPELDSSLLFRRDTCSVHLSNVPPLWLISLRHAAAPPCSVDSPVVRWPGWPCFEEETLL